MPDGSKIPATGKSVTVNNVLIFTFENGKMTSFKNYLDMMSMMGQLGLAG
jgi:predicted ester cyclase